MAEVIQSRLEATVSPGDRLSFTVFLAVALHAALILGVTFTYVSSRPSTHTMEVTLAQQRAKRTPDNADFLAQFNQVGSGALEEKAIMTAPTMAQFQDTEIRDTSRDVQQSSSVKAVEQKQRAITTTAKADHNVTANIEATEAAPQQTELNNKKSLQARALEIASLEARIDHQRQIYTKLNWKKLGTEMKRYESTSLTTKNLWKASNGK